MANKPGEANFFPNVPEFPSMGNFQPVYGKFDLTTYIHGASEYEIMAFLVGKYNACLEAYGNITKLSTDTITACKQLQDWINSWFDNLDVQQELNNKINSMVQDGSFGTLLHQTFDAQINQQTTSAVTAWLVANVTPTGSAVVVDKSLSIEGAAADAKATGEIKKNITGSVEQLFDVSKVEDGYINYDGSVNRIGEYYHTYIPCSPNDVFYINRMADDLTITFFDSNKTFIRTFFATGNKIIVPNDNNISYISIPVIWYMLYLIIISKNPVPIDSGGLLYGNTEYVYNLTSRTDFVEVLKSKSDYDETKFKISKNYQHSLITAKDTLSDNRYWINFRFNTIDLDASYNGSFISIAENDEYIIAFQVNAKKIIRLNKNNNDFIYLTDEISTYNISNKKVNVSIYGGVFKIKDYLTGDVYVKYDVSDSITYYNTISLGVAYIYGTNEYNDIVICSIFNTTDFIKGTIINDKQLEKNQWYGKTWYAYGTSLTNTDSEGKYAKYVEQFSGMNRVNKGISGGGLVASNGNVRKAIMNTTDGKLNADLITLETGANDTDTVLGNIYDTGDDTYCGALNQCIRYLQANTNAQIVVISSTSSRYEYGNPDNKYTPDKTFGSDNHTKYDQWKAIEEVCKLNSVHYIPMGEHSGLGFARMDASNLYNVDQIHHTELGGYNLGKFVWSKLKDIPCWFSELPRE